MVECGRSSFGIQLGFLRAWHTIMDKVMVFYVSECCGVESDKDHEVCSRCGEHCEIITEEYERDYVPGYDDGEW